MRTARSATTPARILTYLSSKSDPWIDLGLTLPILIGYHLGVIFLPTRNAADFTTSRLSALANYSTIAYLGLTITIAAILVAVLTVAGRGKKLVWRRYAAVAAEGAAYAVAMCFIAQTVVGSLHLSSGGQHTFWSGLVRSLGAGFYEEVAFRVAIFGIGLALLLKLVKKRRFLLLVSWAIITSAAFSGWHYYGVLADTFELRSFVFRWICGIAFVAIYHYRGFAPAVWCHTLYDIWVLAL